MYWGGKEADVDALFREYCRLFYGPSEREMLVFFEYCEANWSAMEKDKALADEALALFDAAKAKAPADSAFFQRIALIDDYLEGLRRKSVQLGQKRGLVPTVRLVGDTTGIVIDGKLDDAYWQKTPVSATGSFHELQTGRIPVHATTFKAGWQAGSVCFAIRCEEPDAQPNIGTKTDDDSALWYGDCIEILLETEARSYYQIAVAPSGAVADLDRSAPREAWFGWDAQAEVATHTGDGFWTVEIRIPVTQDENDPLHQVIGSKPTQSLPWHLNLCRQRIREDGIEHSAVSPTGVNNFHTPMKFAHFYDGRSHTFEASVLEGDFLTDFRAAAELTRTRKHAEALAAFLAIADAGDREPALTDEQRASVLEQATASARALGDFAKAEEIAARIPVEAVRKTARLQSLLAQYQSAKIVAEFQNEDFAAWPYWKRGEGLFLRGRASAVMKDGEGAVADYTRSLPLLGDPRMRQSLNLALGQALELLKNDDAAALPVYRAVYGDAATVGGADELGAVQAVARILTRQLQTDAALAELARIDTAKIGGTWRHSTLLARADAHAAAGRKAEAISLCREVLADPAAEKRHQEAGTKKIAEWE